jgi:dihydroxyacetone kinase-like protein
MKKLINDVENAMSESLAGFCAAHSDIVRMGEHAPFVLRRHLKPGKVALISGGGSGHEPLHSGFVGFGMLDAACPGQVFTSPTPDLILAAAEAADTGGGVLFIVKNYEGDVMNFEMAREMSGKPIATVITDDDVAVETSTFSTGRRGVAGTLIVEKILGAAAEQGRDLAGLKALGDRVNAATRSIGIALTSCTVPAAGKPTFDIAEDEMEIGVGIHGEPGRRRVKLNCGRDGQRHRSRSRRACAWRGYPVDQRLRRDAAFGALSDVRGRSQTARTGRHDCGAIAGRQFCHLARYGGLFGDGIDDR